MNTLGSMMARILLLLALITVPVTAKAAIDATQPTTAATLMGTKGSDGWYTTSVSVTLAASDGADGSGVANTEYSLDKATWQPYSAPFVLDKDGSQFIHYRSTDNSGNLESPAKSQEIKINKTGLVGLWHMDGNWNDSSVVGNNGTPNNGVTFSQNAKIGPLAGSFDGVNDYVIIQNNPALNFGSGDFSIEYWMKVNDTLSPNTEYGVINKNSRFEKSPGWGMELSTYGSPSHTCTIRLFITSQNLWGNAAAYASINTNNWYHVVGIRKGTSTKIYINGELKALTNHPDAALSVDNAVQLIWGKNSWGPYFPGAIDEVAIYNRALSDIEIQKHYLDYVVNRPTVTPVTTPTTSAIITLSGTKTANTAIAVNGSTLVPLDAATSWKASYTLSQGMNTIPVTAMDSQNLNSLPVTLTVILDSAPPQVTATTPANNAILKTSPSEVTFTLADALSPLDHTATLTGAAATHASGFNVSGTWSSSGSSTAGTVKFTPTSTLSEGTYTFVIKPTDTLANNSTYPLTFSIDRTPPVAPGIDLVTVPINTSSKTITGSKSSDSASVVVSCAEGTIGTISYPTATTWSADVSGLKEGSNTITAYAVDTAGNTSATVSAAITVDTTPPVVGATPAGGIYSSAQSVALAVNEQAAIYYTMDGSTPTASATVYSHPIAIPAGATLKYFARDLAGNNSEIRTENYVIDTTSPVLAISTLSDGTYTNNEILNIAGTVMDDTGVTGITVNDAAVQVNAEGSFSYALLLKNGINMITIATKDNAGNTAVDTRTITLDQTAPALIIATPADNSKTASALITVSGSVDETSSVLVTLGDSVQFAAQTGSAFSADVTLVPGYNTIEITAADLAGNRSSQKRTILYDDQKPSLAITEPNQDLRTNQGSLTIRGTASDPLTTVSVTVVVDGQTFVPQLLNGLFEQAVTFSEEKSHSIIVTATNEVETITSVQRNVIYDITPPSLGIDPIASPTSQPSLSVTGTREAGTAVAVTCITAAVGEVLYPTATTWLADISGLREGENVIAAASTDAAGNVVTAKGTVVLATRPPEITITATPDVIWQPDRRMVPVTIAGGVEAHGSDIKSVLISVSDEYGKFEYSNLTFGSTVMLEAWRNGNDTDGRKYTITAVVTDKGGVTTAKKATVTVPHSQNQDQTQKRQGFQLNKHKSKGVSPSGRARGNK